MRVARSVIAPTRPWTVRAASIGGDLETDIHFASRVGKEPISGDSFDRAK
jgi:hypothetical protein